MKGLQRISSEEQLDQFMTLWDMIAGVQLGAEPDTIKWTLTTDGSYSARSVYDVQFPPRTPQPNLMKVWKCRAEGKVNFHVWLVLQNRTWTADRLRARGWDHNPKCCFCDQTIECVFHLYLQCSFAKELWLALKQDFPELQFIADRATSTVEWWADLTKSAATKEKRWDITVAMYTIWNIWLERNQRAFQGSLFLLIKDEPGFLREAFRE